MRAAAALALLGITAFLIALVVNAPAERIAARLLPPEIDARDVRGTLLAGTAAAVNSGAVELRRFSWRVRPAALATGHLEVRVRGHVAGGGRFEARLRRGLSEKITIEDARLHLPATRITEWLAEPPPARPGGELHARVETAVLEGRRPTRLTGRVTWRGGTITAFDETVALGDFRLDLATPEPGRITGEFTDAGQGPVGIDGTGRLGPDGTIQGEARVRIAPDADPRLLQALRFGGIPEPERPFALDFSADPARPDSWRGRLH